LVDAGVDGFEIANFGHPYVAPHIHRALLEICRSRGLALIASSDWHGWGGLARTWTVIRAFGASALTPPERANLVLSTVRERRVADIIPVVSGFMGAPSLMRAVFTPVSETLRYAMELSPMRVLSWWIWTSVVSIIWIFLRRIGANPGRIVFGALVGGIGLGLVYSGISLIAETEGCIACYTGWIALAALISGAIAFLSSLAWTLPRWREIWIDHK
jgi:hypothetical protein